MRLVFLFCGTLLGCSGGGARVVPVGSTPVQAASSQARHLGKPHVVWRREWRTSRDRTVCPTARLAVDRAGNVYLPGSYWGRLELPGAVRETTNEAAILLRVDSRGGATPLLFGEAPAEDSRSILGLSVSPAGDQLITIAQSVSRGLVWSRRGATNVERRLEGSSDAILLGDDAVVTFGIGGLSLERGGEFVWLRGGRPETPLPGLLTHVAYDGGRRIAVAGVYRGQKHGGIAVLDLDGSFLYAHSFRDRPVESVSDIAFDAEGALWVLGTSDRIVVSGGVATLVTVPDRHGEKAYVTDGFLLRYDRNGKALLDLTLTTGRSFHATYLDVSTGVAYFVPNVWRGMPPHYVPSPGEKSPATLLVAVDRSGAVTVLDRMEGEPADGQVLAQGDTLTVALEHTLWDKVHGHPYLDCELVRYAFPPP